MHVKACDVSRKRITWDGYFRGAIRDKVVKNAHNTVLRYNKMSDEEIAYDERSPQP